MTIGLAVIESLHLINSHHQGMIKRIRKIGLTGEKLVSPYRSGFMRFSHKMDYGLYLLTALAEAYGKGQISLRKVADESQMSFFFLQKVALDLRKAKLIEAGRGKNGGYVLVKSPKEISLKEIVEAIEGPMALMECLAHGPDEQSCVRENSCGVRGGISFINELIVKTFGSTKLIDLINKHEQLVTN